jgi:hypothetical protein
MKKLFVCGLMLTSAIVFSQETVTRNLSSFSKLSVGGSFETFIEQGSNESVKIIAEGVSAEKIITEVKDNTLEISLERGEYHNIKIKIYLTYKKLDEINKSGSGNLTCSSDFNVPGFTLEVSGSGNTIIHKSIKAQQVKLNKSGSGNVKLGSLETNDADLSLSGSGNIDIADGRAKKQAVHISGSGSVGAYGVKSEECTASITGSGDIHISVSQLLEGRIAGSGSIIYQGNAQLKEANIIGSGRISRKS